MQMQKSTSGVPGIISGQTAAFDAASCGAAAVTLQSVPIPGNGDGSCIPGDIIIVRPRTAIANLQWGPGSCTVAGTAIIPVTNPTAAPIDPASTAFDYVIIRTNNN
jgi:hypothetical protein